LSSIYLIVLDFLIHCIFVNTFLADMKVFCTFVLKYLTNGNIRTEQVATLILISSIVDANIVYRWFQ